MSSEVEIREDGGAAGDQDQARYRDRDLERHRPGGCLRSGRGILALRDPSVRRACIDYRKKESASEPSRPIEMIVEVGRPPVGPEPSQIDSWVRLWLVVVEVEMVVSMNKGAMTIF